MGRTSLASLILPVFLALLLAARSHAPLSARLVRMPTRLYILGESPVRRGNSLTGRVSIVDPKTGRELRAFSAGDDIDATVSPDGARLFVAGVDASTDVGGPGQDFLTASDLRDGRQIWSVAIQNRSKYIGGGPSTLVVSPDGRYLYVYSYSAAPLTDVHAPAPFWFQIVDVATGRLLPETISLPDCGGASFQLVPGSTTLIASCFERSDLRFIDLTARRVERTLSLVGPGILVGTALSPDGRRLYAVTNTLNVAIVDVAKRAIEREVLLGRPGGWKNPGFMALTADGTWLVVGENVQAIAGTDTAVEFQAYDTRTWQEVAQIHVDRPLSYTLAASPDGHSVYALGGALVKPPGSPDTIIYDLDLDHHTLRPFLRRPGESVVRVFLGP